MTNPDRLFFVTPEATAKLLEACPDAQWRAIVALWIGNSTTIAAKHYLQVTEGDYAAALQIPVQSGRNWAVSSGQV